MIGDYIDRAIGILSPSWAVSRMQARATMQQIQAVSNSTGGYNAGKHNRFTKASGRLPMTENQVPRGQLDKIRADSWDLYRNNPYARKIVRTIETKVIGRGLHPLPLAKRPTGEPHEEFRRRAREIWWEWCRHSDIRGLPGRGGLDFVEQCKLILRSTVLCGGSLVRYVPLTPAQQRESGRPIPLALQVIDIRRLSPYDKAEGFIDGNQFYRGVELDSRGMRVAYHVLTPRYDELTSDRETLSREPAANVLHVFMQEDVDQIIGFPWFSASLLQFRDGGDLQFNVLTASKVASCVALGYRLGTGQKRIGLASQESDGGATDVDGNAISMMQPGMLINLGSDGKLEGFSPAQPTTNMESFIQHVLRGVAQGAPGVKASTVTGDYRNSSFSSERSADNDCWPEMESLQDWFAATCVQPVYERVISDAVLSGQFAGIVDVEEFADYRSSFLDVKWRGPVPRAINPQDEAKADALRVSMGHISPQDVCGALGTDAVDVLTDVSEFITAAKGLGIPDWYIDAALGRPAVAAPSAEAQPQPQEGAVDGE